MYEHIRKKGLTLNEASHVGITASNLERSVDFYRAITGVEPEMKNTLEGSRIARAANWGEDCPVRFATLILENLNIDLLEIPNAATPNQGSLQQNGRVHFCFTVDDLADARAHLEETGIEFLGPSYLMTQGGASRFIYFQGPDGEGLELMEARGRLKR